ncbi:hypothetical protein IW262DRAFT_1485591 [Armillaria fumosa]|nr:hypothetical protein IW262DRAFT_1485591 [Armillaria fumosa]
MAIKPVAVIASLGSGSGTGAAVARLLVKEGYAIALVARNADSVKALADEINAAGGTVAPFPISSYSATDIDSAYERRNDAEWEQNEDVRLSPVGIALLFVFHTSLIRVTLHAGFDVVDLVCNISLTKVLESTERATANFQHLSRDSRNLHRQHGDSDAARADLVFSQTVPAHDMPRIVQTIKPTGVLLSLPFTVVELSPRSRSYCQFPYTSKKKNFHLTTRFEIQKSLIPCIHAIGYRESAISGNAEGVLYRGVNFDVQLSTSKNIWRGYIGQHPLHESM